MTFSHLGKLGADEGPPVLVPWHWYYARPTLLPYILLGVLLLAVRENRNWQVWLILVLPLAAAALQPQVMSGPFGSDFDMGFLVHMVAIFAISWTAFWLLTPWLRMRNRREAFVSLLAVMSTGAAVGCVAYFGLWVEPCTAISTFLLWGILCAVLFLALVGCCRTCRQTCRVGALAIWLPVWLMLLTTIAATALFLPIMLIAAITGEPDATVQVAKLAACVALGVAAFLYGINLPVLLLAGWTDQYRRRLQGLVSPPPTRRAPLPGGDPFRGNV